MNNNDYGNVPHPQSWRIMGTRLARIAPPIIPLPKITNDDHLGFEYKFTRTKERNFSLFLQPVVELATGVVAGFEATLRWFHPSAGELGPKQLSALAHRSNLADRLLLATLAKAAGAAVPWGNDHFIALSTSAELLCQSGLFEQVEEVLKMANFAAQRLHIEVSGAGLISNSLAALQSTCRLRDSGVTVALVVSSETQADLCAIGAYPFNSIKYNLAKLPGPSAQTGTCLRDVADVAHNKSLILTSGEIHSRGQARQARAAGCTYGQGLWFGRPCPAALLNDPALREARLGYRTYEACF